MTKLIEFFKDESGASAAEYALILAVVGLGILVAAQNLGSAITTAMNSTTSVLKNPTAAP